jgi:hypothetical protein
VLRICENPDCSVEFAVDFLKCPACGTPRTGYALQGQSWQVPSTESTIEDSESKGGWGDFFFAIVDIMMHPYSRFRR